MGGIISSIETGSIAEDLGWRIGDEIVSINGHFLQDIIDYRFYESEDLVNVLIRRGYESAEFEIEKDFDMPLGVSFEDILFDGVRTCGAHCIFCFVEQLPKDLRQTLYMKDDDYRLSFLHGNFVTLANVSEEDLARIVNQRLTPMYISVHSTDQILREKLLGRNCPDILHQIDTLSKGHIELHTQIVLCRGVNDGDYLNRTVEDLAARYPTVQSIAIVPVGLSKHRKNKTPIGSIDPDYSKEIVNRVSHWHKKFLKEKGTRFVWAADEFYLNAGENVPGASVYEGFPQIENGIGLVRKFKDSAGRAKKILPESLEKPLKVSIVTGQLAGQLLRDWAETIQVKNLEIKVYPIVNQLFGEIVTVTGLIVGKDIIDQLQGKDLGDVLVVPSVSLRDNAFLDDVTVADVEEALSCRVLVVDPLPLPLIRCITSI